MNLTELRHVRLHELTKLLGIGRSSIYQMVSDGLFPPPVKMSRRCSSWPLVEIQTVVRARAALKDDEEIRALVKEIVQTRLKGDLDNVA